MTAINSLVSAGILAVAVSFPVNVISNLAIPPKGGSIIIHSLKIQENGRIPNMAQDRTVTAQSALIAQWKATVTTQGGMAVCAGGGYWPYTSGRRVAVISIDEWVGQRGCWDSLPEDVTLQACAVYAWGDGEDARQCTLGFKKSEFMGVGG